MRLLNERRLANACQGIRPLADGISSKELWDILIRIISGGKRTEITCILL